MPRPTPAPFTVQDLIDAVHKAIDDENTACESPARTEAVVVDVPGWPEYYEDTARAALSFVPEDPSGTVDVVLENDGSWSLWDRETLTFAKVGRSLDACVEACLDALDEMGVL